MKENTTPTVSDIFQTLFKENKSQFTENFNKMVSEKVTTSFVYDFINNINLSLNLKYCKVDPNKDFHALDWTRNPYLIEFYNNILRKIDNRIHCKFTVENLVKKSNRKNTKLLIIMTNRLICDILYHLDRDDYYIENIYEDIVYLWIINFMLWYSTFSSIPSNTPFKEMIKSLNPNLEKLITNIRYRLYHKQSISISSLKKIFVFIRNIFDDKNIDYFKNKSFHVLLLYLNLLVIYILLAVVGTF